MASVHHGECQRWAIDNKLTCFGISLDGEAAFPSVERKIQVRELYSAGERGDILKFSRNFLSIKETDRGIPVPVVIIKPTSTPTC